MRIIQRTWSPTEEQHRAAARVLAGSPAEPHDASRSCRCAWNRSGSSAAPRLFSALPALVSVLKHSISPLLGRPSQTELGWPDRIKGQDKEPKFVWSCRRSVRLVHRLSPDCCGRCDLGGGALNQPPPPVLPPFCTICTPTWPKVVRDVMLNPEVQSWCLCLGPVQHVVVHLCAEASEFCEGHMVWF